MSRVRAPGSAGHPRLTGLVWAGTLALCVVGVTAGVVRATFVTDAAARAEPLRQRILQGFGKADLPIADRPGEVRRFDARFAERRVPALVHVVTGAVFLAFAPLQFWAGFRNRHRRVHRWSGRVLICAVLLSGATALYFGLDDPYAGPGEAPAIVIVAALLFLAIGRAWMAIRRGDVERHREWMLRAFALAVGIATIRVLGGVIDVALSPLGLRFGTELLISLWLGWALSVAAAEWWIVRTR